MLNIHFSSESAERLHYLWLTRAKLVFLCLFYFLF